MTHLRKVSTASPTNQMRSRNVWNQMIQTAQDVKNIAQRQLAELYEDPRVNTNRQYCFNDTGEDIVMGEPCVLVKPQIEPTEDADNWNVQSLMWSVRRVTAGDYGKVAIAATEILNGEGGYALVAGLATAKVLVPSNGEWITRADVDIEGTTTDSLVATPHGSSEILWKEAGEGVKEALVNVNAQDIVILKGVAKETIPPNGSGEVTIWDQVSTTNYDVTAHLDWMHSDTQVSQGKQCLVCWFPNERLWRMIAAECEVPIPPIMLWNGAYSEAATREISGPPYPPYCMMRDGIWLMVTNKETSDRPAPQAAGTPVWSLPDSPGFVTQNDPGYVNTANQYTLNSLLTYQGYRAYIPTNAAGYEITVYVSRINESGNATVLGSQAIPTGRTGWVEVPVSPTVFIPGIKLEIGLITFNHATETTILDGSWRYGGSSQGIDPGGGEWNHDNQNLILRINVVDDDATNHTTELNNLVVDDVVVVKGEVTGAEYRYVITALNGGVAVVSYNVIRTLQTGTILLDERCTISCVRATSTSDYSEAANYWQTNGPPSWASAVSGLLLTTEGGTPVLNSNAYGVDLLFDDLVQSPDWDFASAAFI